ncbi:multicopper oxidase-domain-containing protein [Lipomyces starkeyi]
MFTSLGLVALLLFQLFEVKTSDAALRSYNLTIHSESRAPDGVSREVYLINGQQPGPLIEAEEGDDLEVFVQNDLAVENTIHWHGLLQRGTPQMDGVPGVTQVPIPPGGNFTYRFSVKDQYGFYWYHSHFRAYYDDSIRGSFIIHPSLSRRRPFESIAGNNTEMLRALLQAEREAASILLTDWYHSLSDDVFSQYFETGAFPGCVDSLLANGYGRVQCLPDYILQAGTGLGIEPASSTNTHDPASTPMASMFPQSMSTDSAADSMSMVMPGMLKRMITGSSNMAAIMSNEAITSGTTVIPSETPSQSPVESTRTKMFSMSSMSSMSGMSNMSLTPRGCTPPMMFRQGFNVSSLPPETCTNTTSTLLTLSANSSQGWLALNLVNAGSVSRLSVSLDAHSMFVYAADGLFVSLQEVKVLHISIGQRYSVMIKLNQPPGDYLLRYASNPFGDMQQVIEGQAIISYNANSTGGFDSGVILDDPAAVWILTNGSAKLGSSELNDQLLAPFESNMPPSAPADVTRFFTISQTDIVTWVVDGYPYSEPKMPIIYGNVSDAWTANTTLHMPFNSTVDIVMQIANDSMDTMGHPMHLHGHKFWVLGSGSGTFPYETVVDAPESIINLNNPPYRDTVDLPPSGWAAIRYVTDNPGAWLFHCHIQWHLMSGMAMVLVEGEDQLPGLVGMPVNATGSPAASASSTATATSLTVTVANSVTTAATGTPTGAAPTWKVYNYRAYLICAALGISLIFY